MLVLRRDQIERVVGGRLRGLEERLEAHLRRFFQRQLQPLPPERVTELVRRGIRRGGLHGFASERDLCKYLSLVCIFGLHFDTDPALPWAAETLALNRSPSKKMERLYALGVERAEDGRGPGEWELREPREPGS